MKSRYIYCPAVGKVGRRVTLAERIKQRFRARNRPDLFMVTGYEQPIYPTKSPDRSQGANEG